MGCWEVSIEAMREQVEVPAKGDPNLAVGPARRVVLSEWCKMIWNRMLERWMMGDESELVVVKHLSGIF
jgi:hypothetical protein